MADIRYNNQLGGIHMNTTNRNLNVNQSYDLPSTDHLPSSSAPKTKAEINEFIKGQLIKGKVLDLRDCDIRLLLSDGSILKGTIDPTIPLTIGEQATLIVEQNTDKLYLRLQPKDVFDSYDTTIDKALEEAMLPKNEKNLTVVHTLLKYGMSIDKNNILSMLRQSSMFREISIETLAIMNKYQIPMTQTNATQLEIYRNYEFRLLNQSEQLTALIKKALTDDTKPESISQFMKSLQIARVASFEDGLTPITQGFEQTSPPPDIIHDNMSSATQNPLWKADVHTDINSNVNVNVNIKEASHVNSSQSDTTTLLTSHNPTEDYHQNPNMSQQVKSSLVNSDISNVPNSMLFLDPFNPKDMQLLEQWLSDKFTLSLDKLRQQDSIPKFYEEVESLLNQLQSIFKEQWKDNTTEAKSNVLSQLTQMKENLDFIKTMNQLYGYVQLPMMLTEHTTHGELFVYTNKKQLRTENGEVSVLLHLDMSYLGPIDVHLSLIGRQVKAKISLEEESSLNLVKQHLPDLETALQKKGFQIITQFEKLEQKTKVLRDYFESSPSELLMKRYTFDKRA